MNEKYRVTIVSEGGIPVIAHMPEDFTMDVSSDYSAPFASGLTGSDKIDGALRLSGYRLVNQAMSVQIWQGSAETNLGLELEFQAINDPIKEVRDPILQLMKYTVPQLTENGLMRSPGPVIDEKAGGQIVSDLSAGAQRLFKKATEMGGELLGFSSEHTELKQANLADVHRSCTNGNTQSRATQTPEQNSQYGATNSLKKYIKNQISIRIGEFAFFESVVITNVQKTYEARFDAFTGYPHYAKVSIQFKPLFMIVQSDLDQIFVTRKSGPSDTATPSEVSSVAEAFALGEQPGTNLQIGPLNIKF